MAHKKSGGSTDLGRDSISKRLGVKIFGGQLARAGQVIVRQRGSHYRAGNGVRRGGDDTLYAACDGVVKFSKRKIAKFTGSLKKIKVVSLESK